MAKNTVNSRLNFYYKIKNTKTVNFINNLIVSPFGIAIIGAICLLTHILALEFLFYIFIGILIVFICLFSPDLLGLMPVFVFCYISPAKKNNPGVSEQSMFYGSTGVLIGVVVTISIIAFILRVALDKNIGFKKFFKTKRSLLGGIIALGVAYLISGIGAQNYFDVFLNNLIFASLQFLSIFLLYFIFTATVDWKNVKKDYFAWLMVIMGLVVCAQVAYIYVSSSVIENGTITRSKILTGWGIYNNIGALISMSIPFAFYLACKKNFSYIYLTIASLLLVGLICSCSRGSIVGGAFIYVFSFIVTFVKAKNKKEFRISSAVLIAFVIMLCLIFSSTLIELFKKVPSIIKQTENNSLAFNDSSRFKIYEQGFYAFLQDPILGQSFYPYSYVPYGYSKVESFSSFFPPRWHNTIIQILASCGIVGIIAYAYHRFQTVKLMFKKPSLEKSFIGLSILCLLLMSLLDCHFFNIGPTLIYSMALAFAEKINSCDETQNAIKTIN
ncbi:MAG: O-antigen ligase family protein [Clostridia bacterium]|nr:O-antigen ligase family protein [Clostridia bacterium]